LLWAVLAFLFNYIPNIGSIIAAVPAVLLAFVQLGPATAGFTALGTVGMLLSVPLTMIVKIALQSSPDSRWVALLLASDNDEPVI
jgi:predicted PurR-regulated permease PerM